MAGEGEGEGSNKVAVDLRDLSEFCEKSFKEIKAKKRF